MFIINLDGTKPEAIPPSQKIYLIIFKAQNLLISNTTLILSTPSPITAIH